MCVECGRLIHCKFKENEMGVPYSHISPEDGAKNESLMIPKKFAVTGTFNFPIDMMVNRTLKFPQSYQEVAEESSRNEAEKIMRGFQYVLQESGMNGVSNFDFNIEEVEVGEE